MQDDVFVRFIKMPTRMHEFVTPCDEGYCVYINESMDYPHQLKAYLHALSHIKNEDWNKDDVQEIEAEAHEVNK